MTHSGEHLVKIGWYRVDSKAASFVYRSINSSENRYFSCALPATGDFSNFQ